MGNEAPAVEGTLRQAAVDQDQRDAALLGGDDQVGPQVGLDQQREVGLPIVEEALDEARRIERHELMDDGFRQPLLRDAGRADGPGRAENRELLFAEAFDQRDHGEHLADTRAVDPDQRTSRPRDAALAVALGHSCRMLLAALEPMRQQQRRERSRGHRENAVRAQRKREEIRHGRRLGAAGRRSRRRARSRR